MNASYECNVAEAVDAQAIKHGIAKNVARRNLVRIRLLPHRQFTRDSAGLLSAAYAEANSTPLAAGNIAPHTADFKYVIFSLAKGAADHVKSPHG
jgi:hypothetical protein